MQDTMSSAFLNNAAGPQMYNNALALIRLWREKARLAGGHPFVAVEDVKAAAMDIIWGATFGSQMNVSDAQTKLLSSLGHIEQPADQEAEIVFPRAADPESFKAVLTICDTVEIPATALFPRFQHRWALRLFPSLRKAVAHKDRLIDEALKRAASKFSVATEDDDAVKSALDLVVQRESQLAKKEGRTPKWNTPDIRDELFGFLVAGHDTSSTSIQWAFKRLSDNQDIQNKLRAALRDAYPRAVAAGELPTAKEISGTKIPYLDAVIEEVHRGTGAVGAMMRVATVDTVVLGHRIPKGTDVFMLTQGPDFIMPSIPIEESVRSNTSRESKDKNGSWDQATIADFDPERWLEKDSGGNEVFNSRAGPTMPFGAGPRACFGMSTRSRASVQFIGPEPEHLHFSRSQIGRTRDPHVDHSDSHELQARQGIASVERIRITCRDHPHAMAMLCEA
jgi:cytochrome P450